MRLFGTLPAQHFDFVDLLLSWAIPAALIVLTIYLLAAEALSVSTSNRPNRRRRTWRFHLPLMFALTASAAVVSAIVVWAGDESFNLLVLLFLAVSLVFFVCVFYALAIFFGDILSGLRRRGAGSRIHAFLTRRLRARPRQSPLDPPTDDVDTIKLPGLESVSPDPPPPKKKKWWRRMWRNRYRPYVHGQNYTHPMGPDDF